MSPPVRRPTFLAALDPEAEARPAAFVPAAAAPRLAIPRPAHPGASAPAAGEAAPAGPTAEQLEAIRAEAIEKVTHAVEVLRLQSERLAEQARSDALEIGFEVARRILETELSTGPDALFALVKSALQRAGASRRVVIRLHAEDARLVQAALAEDRLGISAAAVEVTPDPALERGDCMVETDFGKVDGRLKTRLEELHRAARTALEEGVG